MGKAVCALAEETEGIEIVFGVDPKEGKRFSDCAEKADVAIDFSVPEALPEALEFCIQNGTPLVLATTGHGVRALEMVSRAAEQIAILKSANLSYGAFVLSKLSRMAREMLSAPYDVAIVETHHRAKKDAPSGTAKMLAGVMGAEDAQMLSVRGGGVNGVHEVCFLGAYDTITLTHSALDRRLFADGALRAAKWVAGCAPGLYGMEDFIENG